MSGRAYGSGKLSMHDHAQIESLAEQGLGAGQIAHRIKRHQGTVAWYMYSNGLKVPQPTPEKARTYFRGGILVRQWDRDEEAAAVALRAKGLSFREVALQLFVQHGYSRNAHSVQVRLVMISNREEESQ